MVKIGVLGSDNSHSLHYSKLINTRDESTGDFLWPEFKVTHIFGTDMELTRQRAREAQIQQVVESPEDMLGKVDAAIVDFRHGDLHAKYALPFLAAGIPVFVDKPFTNKIDDVKMLIETARKNNAILTGGSSNKYLDGIVEMKKYLEDKSVSRTGIDTFVTATVSFQINLSPEYGGIHFYGPHTVEPAMFLFGYDVRSVYASRMDKNILAIMKYDRFQIALNFMYQGEGQYINLMEKDGQINKKADDSDDYKKCMENFIRVLKSGKSDLSYEQILMPVVVLNAIEQSMLHQKEIYVDGLK